MELGWSDDDNDDDDDEAAALLTLVPAPTFATTERVPMSTKASVPDLG